MGVHAYCIVPPGHAPPPGLRGLDDEGVAGADVGGLLVWYSAAARRPRPDLERVRTHDRVVRAAMQAATPLPFRFGQWFEDVGRLEASVGTGLRDHLKALAEVAGALEFGVRLEAGPELGTEGARADARVPGGGSSSGEAAPSGGPGAAYLRRLARRDSARAEHRRRGGEVFARLHACLQGRVRRVLVDDLPARGSWASAAHLVPRSGIATYRAEVERFARERSEIRIRLTGPWPPYSFTDGSGS
jgi:hypothetical protein